MKDISSVSLAQYWQHYMHVEISLLPS